MRWNKETDAISLGQSDLQVMAQCGMELKQVLGAERKNRNIPHLWSMLSYAMLQCNSDPDHVWQRYRTLQQMATDTGAWYYTRLIPKSGGGFRRIAVPSHRIRGQQEFILEHILSELPVSQYACAYRKGMGSTDCAEPHVGRDVVLHLDIQDFFGSVTEDMVFELFCRETGYGKALCRLLARLCCYRGSIPQGTVTSPALSNAVFRPCDEELAAIAARYGLRYTRYSDDLFFSGDGEIPVEQVLGMVRVTLLSYGFFVNERKTRVLRQQRRQEILGMTVNERLQITRPYRRKLLQELHYLEKFGERCDGAVACGDYLQYMQQLQGKLAYVLHADPDNEKLKIARQKLLRRMNRQIRAQELG